MVWALPIRSRLLRLGSVTVLALLLGVLIRLLTVEAKPGLVPTPFRAPFDNGVTLVAWELPASPLCIGEESQLRTWWHVARTPDTDFKFFTHVILPDDSAKVAQFDTFPSDGYNPMTRWESGELVPQAQGLLLDASVLPGRYLLILGLYDPLAMVNARVLEAPAVLPGDRLVLSEIEVSACEP